MSKSWVEEGAKWLVSGSLMVGLSSCGEGEETSWEQSQKKSISGKITIHPSLEEKIAATDTLFVMAKGESGPPIAVKKIAPVQFPLQYTLDENDLMLPGMVFPEKVFVSVRVDKDGNASLPQPGDMEGHAAKNPISVGAEPVDLEINHIY